MIDEFLSGHAPKLNKGDFEDKNGRMFLKKRESYKLIKAIKKLFDRRIGHQGIKKFGEYSTIRTAIREEVIKLAQYVRSERREMNPFGLMKHIFIIRVDRKIGSNLSYRGG